MKKILYAVALLCLSGTAALAQQLPQFSHYGFNGMYISPGYAGVSKQTEFNFIGRYQWAGYDASFNDKGGSPQTGIISASIPWQSASSGIGLNLIYDRIGVTNVQNVQLSYAYHVSLGSGTLGIGLQGNANRISKGEYRPNDPGDPRVPFNSADTKFDAGAGLWYNADNFYVGAGVVNLLGAKYEFDNKENSPGKGVVTGEKHIMATAGYHIEAGATTVITPTAIVKTDFDNTSFEVGARAEFNEKFYAGLGYRHEEAVTALLGVNLMKGNAMRIGYAFDLTTVDKEAKSTTSHEIMLSYRLPKVRAFRPAVRTPRYSF
jgi:type IX secretion system PorP/SprF family membrane protein